MCVDYRKRQPPGCDEPVHRSFPCLALGVGVQVQSDREVMSLEKSASTHPQPQNPRFLLEVGRVRAGPVRYEETRGAVKSRRFVQSTGYLLFTVFWKWWKQPSSSQPEGEG